MTCTPPETQNGLRCAGNTPKPRNRENLVSLPGSILPHRWGEGNPSVSSNRHIFTREECQLGYTRALESLSARFPDRDAHCLLFALIYRKADTQTRRASRQRQRARRAAAPGSFTAAEWRTICGQFGNVCLACGQDGPLSVDHVVPLSRGGRNDADNLQPLCLPCNIRKGTRTVDYRRLAQ